MKKVVGQIKLQIPGGKATPAPPVGPALGQAGVNIMDFCKAFNAKTAKDEGLIIPVVITVYADRSYTFITKTPPVAVLIKREAGSAKGSGEPNKNKVGKISMKQVEAIAKLKMPDLTAADLKAAVNTVLGTARSMGVEVSGEGVGPGESVGQYHRAPAAGRRARWERLEGRERSRMGRVGKKFKKAKEAAAAKPHYPLPEAVATVTKTAFAKFDETVEVAVRLGVDPKHADQMVRGTVILPHGLGGKSKRVLVIASGEKLKEAQDAGADHVGGEDMVAKIQEGWLDFDAVVATPDMMRSVGKLGKVLGPRGLMPNPKTGTVSFEVGKAVREIKAGKVEYRVDKTSIIHAPIGKVSFGPDRLLENAKTLLDSVIKARPAATKEIG